MLLTLTCVLSLPFYPPDGTIAQHKQSGKLYQTARLTDPGNGILIGLTGAQIAGSGVDVVYVGVVPPNEFARSYRLYRLEE